MNFRALGDLCRRGMSLDMRRKGATELTVRVWSSSERGTSCRPRVQELACLRSTCREKYGQQESRTRSEVQNPPAAPPRPTCRGGRSAVQRRNSLLRRFEATLPAVPPNLVPAILSPLTILPQILYPFDLALSFLGLFLTSPRTCPLV